MRLNRIHHVAYVVPDLDEALPHFTARYGLTVAVRELMDDQGVEALALGSGPGFVELIAPTTPDSGVARFLERRGPGLHHVAYEVDDLGAALAELRTEGATLIDEAPRRGLGGHLVAFVHPESAFGALTELVQAESD
jgi:methylmalonyl-CoA/ethylmalonyl-CoA epimerase